eukprot:Awhi_evm1s11123
MTKPGQNTGKVGQEGGPNLIMIKRYHSHMENKLNKANMGEEKKKSKRKNFGAKEYNRLIRKHCQRQEIEKCVEFFIEMKQEGVNPTTLTYNYLIFGYYTKGSLDKMVHYFEEITQSEKISPDARSYGPLIDAYGKIGDIKTMIQYFEDMEKRNVIPSTTIFNSLIDSCGKYDNGISISNRTYNKLINRCCKNKNIDQGIRLFSEMKENGHTPDPVTYSTIIEACLKSGRRNDSLKFMEEMKTSGNLRFDGHQKKANPFKIEGLDERFS